MKLLLFSLVFCIIFSSCSKTEETANVQELNKQFISAWNSKESDKVISYLADDVQFLQGEVHYKGKSEVGDKWVKETASTINNLKLYVVSSGTDNQTAYEAGTFSVDVLPAGPDEPHASGEGNFILLWKKAADGAWKLSYAQLEDLPVQVKNQ